MAARERERERQVILVDGGGKLTRRQWRKFEQVGFRGVHDLDELVLNWSERKVKDLEARGAITSVQIEASLEGAPNVVVTLRDPERALFRRRPGRVEKRKRARRAGPVQVDEGWDPVLPPDVLGRPMQISLDGVTYQLVKVGYADGSGEAQLTFEHELVYLLKRHKGGKRANRKKITRAQFILALVRELEPEVRRRRYRFVCPELNVRQPIDKGGRTGTGGTPVDATSSGANTSGRNLDRVFPGHRSFSGFKLTPDEVRACAAAGGFWGEELDAMEEISRGESAHRPGQFNSTGDGGIGLWQITPYLLHQGGRRNFGAPAINYMERELGGSRGMRNPINNAKMARYLYEAAGKMFGYPAGPWRGTRFLTHYGGPGNGRPSRAECRELAATVTSGAVIEGPANAGAVTAGKSYQFARGAKESSWTAILRLAGEVKWRAFMVGNSLYYMSEEALYGRRPRYEVTPGHDAVVDLGYDIDWGKAASEATLVVTLAKWGAPPGSVILLDGFGPLDGRWLVASTTRDYFSPLAEVKLIQPAKPLLEPAAERKQRATRVDVDVPAGTGDKVRGAIAGSPVAGQKPHAPTHETSGLPGYMAFDYMAPAGTPCLAPVDGKIDRLSGKDPSLGGSPGGPLGYSIYLDGDNGKMYFLTHLDKVKVKTGQRVRQGQKIAEVANGPSSWSSPHVHMGVHG